jgi:hypothetical protein
MPQEKDGGWLLDETPIVKPPDYKKLSEERKKEEEKKAEETK